MKSSFLGLLLFMSGMSATLPVVNTWASEAEPLLHYSCLINKSENLEFWIVKDRLFMGSRWFMESEVTNPNVFQNVQVMLKGDVTYIWRDYGRSGYLWIRLQDQKDGSFLGLFDLNVTMGQHNSQMLGHLTEMPCYVK